MAKPNLSPSKQEAVFQKLASQTNAADCITDDAGNILAVGFSNHASLAPKGDSAPGLTDPSLAELATLPHLETVALQSQPLSDGGYEHLSQISQLRAVAISQPVFVPGLTHACVQSLQGKSETLEALDLDETEAIENDILPLLYGFPRLRFLGIDGKQADNSVAEFAEGAENIEALDLRETTLSDEGLARLLRSLPKLRMLRLGSDGATGINAWSLRHLTHSSSLEVLDLQGTAFANLPWAHGLEPLAELPDLRQLRLPESSEPEAQEAIAKLQAARPDLRIGGDPVNFTDTLGLDWRVGIL